MTYNLTVSPAQLALIGKALGRLPYSQVAELVQSIGAQVVKQQDKPDETI